MILYITSQNLLIACVHVLIFIKHINFKKHKAYFLAQVKNLTISEWHGKLYKH